LCKTWAKHLTSAFRRIDFLKRVFPAIEVLMLEFQKVGNLMMAKNGRGRPRPAIFGQVFLAQTLLKLDSAALAIMLCSSARLLIKNLDGCINRPG
jgi:hypothetical protein